MQQWRQAALAAIVVAAGFTAPAGAQTVMYVTNAYELKVQQTSSGALTDGSLYASFAGEAKAVNNKVAADLKGFSVTIFYAIDDGAATVTGGTFVIQTTNRDRSPLNVGGNILPGDTIRLRPNGSVANGETLSLPLTGSDGTFVSGVITATVDKGNPPRATGSLSLTYPVVVQ
jgi:hypothetical protein